MHFIEEKDTSSGGKISLVIIIMMLVVIGAAAMLLNPFGQKVNCQKKYDSAKSGEIEAEDIPEECRPIPDHIKKKLLLDAVRGS